MSTTLQPVGAIPPWRVDRNGLPALKASVIGPPPPPRGPPFAPPPYRPGISSSVPLVLPKCILDVCAMPSAHKSCMNLQLFSAATTPQEEYVLPDDDGDDDLMCAVSYTPDHTDPTVYRPRSERRDACSQRGIGRWASITVSPRTN